MLKLTMMDDFLFLKYIQWKKLKKKQTEQNNCNLKLKIVSKCLIINVKILFTLSTRKFSTVR